MLRACWLQEFNFVDFAFAKLYQINYNSDGNNIWKYSDGGQSIDHQLTISCVHYSAVSPVDLIVCIVVAFTLIA